VNPYEVRREIIKATGFLPKNLTSERKDSFTVEVLNETQGKKILTIDQVDGVRCIVEEHPFHNQCKGIIYIQEFEINEENIMEFEAGLKDNKEFKIKKAELAKFIKPRNEQTTPLLITFEQEDTPEYLYIPGERSDSKVYPYQNRPMKCNKCMQYGHTAKRCSRESAVCNLCAENGHTGRDCKSPVLKCLHCKGDHRTGDITCETQKLEQQILDTQNKYKVSKMRAKQIITQNTEEPKQCDKKKYPTTFKCVLDQNTKRKLSPWAIEKCLTQALEGNLKIRSGKEYLIIEVESEQQSTLIMELTHLNNIPVEISEHQGFGTSQGIVYIYNYDLSNFESYKTGIKEDFDVKEVERAHWIKQKTDNKKAIQITFNQANPPDYINLPGEQMHSKVYEVMPRPMRCINCQEYGHTKKYCKKNITTCARCDFEGHSFDSCNNLAATKCHNCKQEHFSGSRICPNYIYEQEILIIQKKEKVPRAQAQIIAQTRNLKVKENYAQKAKKSQERHNEDPAALLKRKGDTPNDGAERSGKHKKTEPSINEREVNKRSETNMEIEIITEKRRRNSSEDESQNENEAPNKNKKQIVEAVLQSPNSGHLYSARIRVDNTLDDSLIEEENLTSENNPQVRTEAVQIYHAYTKMKNQKVEIPKGLDESPSKEKTKLKKIKSNRTKPSPESTQSEMEEEYNAGRQDKEKEKEKKKVSIQ